MKPRYSLLAPVAFRKGLAVRWASWIVSSLCLALWVLSTPLAWASPTTIQGPESQVQLVELFTSEGCSSCPRADATLRDLEEHPDLW